MHLGQVHDIVGDERKKYLKAANYDDIRYCNAAKEKMNPPTAERNTQVRNKRIPFSSDSTPSSIKTNKWKGKAPQNEIRAGKQSTKKAKKSIKWLKVK